MQEMNTLIVIVLGRIIGTASFVNGAFARAIELRPIDHFANPPDVRTCLETLEGHAPFFEAGNPPILVIGLPSSHKKGESDAIERAVEPWREAAHHFGLPSVQYVHQDEWRRSYAFRRGSYARDFAIGRRAAKVLKPGTEVTRPIASAIALGMFFREHPEAGRIQRIGEARYTMRWMPKVAARRNPDLPHS